MRTPISRVRLAIWNTSTPCTPTTARIVASSANPIDRNDSIRSFDMRDVDLLVEGAHVR